MDKKNVIGRKDKAEFPGLGLEEIDVKMDTGAYTSSIHCHSIREVEEEGKRFVLFQLLDPSHEQYQHQEFKQEVFREKLVKNSFGTSEKRFVIETTIVLFGEKYLIQLSLSRRGEMRYPVLLGRRFLMGKFIVDTAKFNLSHKLKKKNLLKTGIKAQKKKP